MSSAQPIRVMVVDKSATIREGLVGFLSTHEEFALVGTATSGVEAVFRAAKIQPDIALVGLSSSNSHIDATISALLRVCPTLRILTFCETEQEDLAREALQAGAVGYVLMSISAEDLRKTLKKAARRPA